VWYLWWTTWHWDRVFSEFFGFPLSKPFHRGSPYSYIIWRINKSPAGGQNSEVSSHPIKMNKKKKKYGLLITFWYE
jgi:hypothetical protein